MKAWTRPDRIARVTGAVSVALAAAASLWLALWPYMYQGVSVSPDSEEPVSSSASLIAVNGYRVIPVLLAPVALATLGLLTIRTGNPRGIRGKIALWAPAVVLLLFCLAAMFSIGMFYLPAAAVLLVATIIAQRQRAPPSPN